MGHYDLLLDDGSAASMPQDGWVFLHCCAARAIGQGGYLGPRLANGEPSTPDGLLDQQRAQMEELAAQAVMFPWASYLRRSGREDEADDYLSRARSVGREEVEEIAAVLRTTIEIVLPGGSSEVWPGQISL